MDRLQERGLIQNLVGKVRSAVLPDEGLKAPEELFRKLFVWK